MEYLMFGMVTGCIILVGTVGFSMIRRAENFLHIAHGQFLLLGAYLAYFFNVTLGLPLWLGAILSVILTGFTGILVSRLLFAPVKRHGGLVLLFTSVGLSYVMYGLTAAVAGGGVRAYPLPTLRAITIAGVQTLTPAEVAVVLIAAGSALGLHLFLTRTVAGRSIRAVASDFDLARIRGVQAGRVSLYVWFIASALAGLAGILLGIKGSLTPEMGWHQILIILSASVLGGMGSIYGVMAGALLLGVGMDMSVIFFPPAYRLAVAFGIIILVLMIRPQGLFKGGAA